MGPGLVADGAAMGDGLVMGGVRDPGTGQSASGGEDMIMCPGPLRQGCISLEVPTGGMGIQQIYQIW